MLADRFRFRFRPRRLVSGNAPRPSASAAEPTDPLDHAPSPELFAVRLLLSHPCAASSIAISIKLGRTNNIKAKWRDGISRATNQGHEGAELCQETV